MDDLAFDLGEIRRVADHPVIEARPDREQHVAVMHRHVRFVGAVHAEHADELRIGRREAAQPHQRVGARKPEQAHELRELRRGLGQDDPATGVDHRPLGLEQEAAPPS